MNSGTMCSQPKIQLFINFRDSALESILLSVLSALEAEMVFIRNLVGGLLAEMEDNIDHDRFKRLLHYSRRLASFKNRATLVLSIFHYPKSSAYIIYPAFIGRRSFGRSFGSRWDNLFLFHRTCAEISFWSDEDMVAMHLSDKKNGIEREDHEELEVLLESFSKQVEEIVNEAENIEVTFLNAGNYDFYLCGRVEQRPINARDSGTHSRLKSKCSLGT